MALASLGRGLVPVGKLDSTAPRIQQNGLFQFLPKYRRFSPPDTDNLLLWVSSDALPAVGHNEPVVTWPGRTPCIYREGLSQPVAANRPVLRQTQIGNFPGVYFNGDNLYNDKIAAHIAGEDKTCTGITVLNVSLGTIYPVAMGTTNAGLAGFFPCSYNNTGILAYRDPDSGSGYSTAVAYTYSNVLHINSSVFRATTASTYANGVVKHNNVAQNYGTISLITYTFGGVRWGSPISISGTFQGTIYEHLFWRTALSDEQRQYVENYLAAKWRIG